MAISQFPNILYCFESMDSFVDYYVLHSMLDSTISSVPQILTDRHCSCCGYKETKHGPLPLRVHFPILESQEEGEGREEN